MLTHDTTIRTRYAESDQMGFIHHSSYVAYFELARVELMRAIGVPYKELEQNDFFLPVLDIYAKYHQPNTFDDEIVIRAILDQMPGVKMTINYEIYRGEVLTTSGHTSHGFINSKGRPCRPPKDFMDVCRKAFDQRSA